MNTIGATINKKRIKTIAKAATNGKSKKSIRKYPTSVTPKTPRVVEYFLNLDE